MNRLLLSGSDWTTNENYFGTVEPSLRIEEVERVRKRGKICVLHLEQILGQYFHQFQIDE